MDQARFEEERRIPWTADMMARWVTAHQGGGHLDLRISSYLAREATATMGALIAEKRMAVPQALLYDLELIREALSATRRLYGEQFSILASHEGGEVAAALREAIPGRRLDPAFVDRLCEDPELEWGRRVRDRASKGFDDDLRDVTRHHDVFMNSLLPSTELSPAGPPLDQNLIARVLSRVTLVPSLPTIVTDQLRGDATARRDDYRELALFASEAGRVSALHAAWGVVDTAVRKQIGAGVLVSELEGATRLSLPASSHSGQWGRPALES